MTRTRILAALVMAPVAIASVLLLPTPWMMLAAAIVFLAALWEWFGLAEIDDSLARGALLVLNLMLMVALVWGTGGTAATLVLFKLAVVLGVVWWLLAMLWLVHYDFASDHDTHARVFKLAAATLAVVPAWCGLALLHNDGPGWLLLALMIVWATDTGAYFAGRAFGKRKLAPRISPNKTVAGLVGGALLGVVVAMAGAWMLGTGLAQLPLVALVALLTVLFSVVGDLLESLLKRHVGVKDSGNLIPGHGGVMDRIDSVLAALPVFALGKIWLGF
ncbi:phosphatidate cytidylyltransferase [Luteimonas sp. Sa2BVA3]|jgi:phosphatidate cytidylyltransferase|uniref:Phosphatidate cytidylyltransferase n=1 Tax=Luteimonas colneyensis TaxID=2762230 RepID=A0ABR8UEI8_9GAMM|nr:phosphatidate cytidylyltransferase [Luteimonas colneyensis]MBD7986452.1 phosphatidate cytidylyltransferase [Luteimonas colneyensis]